MPRDPAKLFPHDYLMKPIVFFVPDFIRPNHVTVFRVLMTPSVLLFLYLEIYPIAVPLFFFVGMTDALDGSIARIRKQITAWGTFYDPVADKIFIGSVLLLVVIQHINPIIAIGLIFIELLIIVGGWFRHKKSSISANNWGKAKMLLEGVGILFLLISLWLGMDLFVDLSTGTLALAIVSLLTYSL